MEPLYLLLYVSKMADQSPTINGVRRESRTSPLDGSSTASITDFVVNLHYSDIPAEAREKLRLLLFDYIGVAAAATRLADSSQAFTKASKTLDSGTGTCTVFANGQCWSPPYAALGNGALSHSLDFDDTHAGARLHPGSSVLSAALAEAESQDSPTQRFICAIAAGYEVTCRLGVTLGAGGYGRGFHNTCTAGLFGAISSIAKLRGFAMETLENAFGIAISKVSGSMQYLSNGSLNKRLHPGFAAHDAFMCCAFAEAGVKGAAQPLEGKWGLYNTYGNDTKTRKTVKEPFIEYWEFLGTAIKPYPGCRITHGSIELADKIGKMEKGPIKTVTVSLVKDFIPVVGEDKLNKRHPITIVDAQFSVYYQVAAALIYGSQLGWQVYDHMSDGEVNILSDKITAKAHPTYSSLQSSMKVEWEDGTQHEEYLECPLGEPTRPITWNAVCAKFMPLVAGVYPQERCEAMCTMVESLEKCTVRDLMILVK